MHFSWEMLQGEQEESCLGEDFEGPETMETAQNHRVPHPSQPGCILYDGCSVIIGWRCARLPKVTVTFIYIFPQGASPPLSCTLSRATLLASPVLEAARSVGKRHKAFVFWLPVLPALL